MEILTGCPLPFNTILCSLENNEFAQGDIMFQYCLNEKRRNWQDIERSRQHAAVGK